MTIFIFLAIAFMVLAIDHIHTRADWWQDEQDAERNIADWRAS